MISKEQLKAIANSIAHTSANVYAVANAAGLKWTEGDFDRLKNQFGLFRCEECSEWKDTSEESGVTNVCEECTESMVG